MSLRRYQRGLRALGSGMNGGTSRLARPPAPALEPDVRPEPDGITFATVYTADNAASSHSAELGGAWGQAAGDYLYNLLFTIGTDDFLGSSEEPAWTSIMSTLAPASPRFVFTWERISGGPGTDGQFYTWDGSVAAGTLTVAANESGLGMWTVDWWSGGPDTSFSEPGFTVHRAGLVFVQSDAGSTVTDAELVFRSDGADVGILEVWAFQGVDAPSTTSVDIEVTALSGDLQWATWIDLYTV